jgi:hypothetical protein
VGIQVKVKSSQTKVLTIQELARLLCKMMDEVTKGNPVVLRGRAARAFVTIFEERIKRKDDLAREIAECLQNPKTFEGIEVPIFDRKTALSIANSVTSEKKKVSSSRNGQLGGRKPGMPWGKSGPKPKVERNREILERLDSGANTREVADAMNLTVTIVRRVRYEAKTPK